MRILLVNRHFWHEHVPTARMAYDVAAEFVNRGCEVDVLTSRSSYARTAGSTTTDRQIKVHYIWTIGESTRLLSWFTFWLCACIRVVSMQWDRCILMTDPPFLVVAAWLDRFVHRARRKIYWWTMDLYPEAMSAQGMIKHGGIVDKFLRKINDVGICNLTGTICLGECQLARLKTYPSWNRSKEFSIVVPPWDYRMIPAVEKKRNRFMQGHGFNGQHIALYAGNLGEAHSFEELLDAAEVLHGEERKDWLFVFVARGSRRQDLENASANLENVVVLDYQPVDLTADLLWSADIHVITMREGWQGVVVPSKLYGVLQTDAPVLFVGLNDSGTALEINRRCAGKVLACGCRGEEVVRALDEPLNGNRRTVGHDTYKETHAIVDFVLVDARTVDSCLQPRQIPPKLTNDKSEKDSVLLQRPTSGIQEDSFSTRQARKQFK